MYGDLRSSGSAQVANTATISRILMAAATQTLTKSRSVTTQAAICLKEVSSQTVARSTARSKAELDDEYLCNRGQIVTALLVEAELEYAELLGLPTGGALMRALIEEKRGMHIIVKTMALKQVGEPVGAFLSELKGEATANTDTSLSTCGVGDGVMAEANTATSLAAINDSGIVLTAPPCTSTPRMWQCRHCGIEDNGAFDTHCYTCGDSR